MSCEFRVGVSQVNCARDRIEGNLAYISDLDACDTRETRARLEVA